MIKKATLVLYNGIIHTMTSQHHNAKAIALYHDDIIYIGDNHTALSLLAPNGRSLDLQGQTLLPGFLESHIHPPGSIIEDLYSISLFSATDCDEILRRIRSFVQRHPELPAYFGAGLNACLFGIPGPRKELLDLISPDKPIYIRSVDGHSLWLNSAAFAAVGIDRDTQVTSGVLHRTDAGDLWGICTDMNWPAMPRQQFTAQQRLEAMRAFQQRMYSWGYTGMLALSGLDQLLQLAELDELRLRVNITQTIRADAEPFVEQLLSAVRLRESLPPQLRFTTVKFFADGVIEGCTAHLLEPYLPGTVPGKGDEYRGHSNWQRQEFSEAIALANHLGFDIHVHSIGDAATRLTLDAIEQAGQRSGDCGQRNSISHLQLVDPADIPRFAALDVIASVQPYWHLKQPTWYDTFELYPLGAKRAEAMYPLRTLLDSGALLCSSSDYSATPVPNPFWAIKAGVTRNLYNGTVFGTPEIDDIDDPTYLLNADERVSTREMLRSFTVNNAYMLRRERELGCLKTGLKADFIVVDKDPLSTDPLDLDKIEVQQTYIGGRCVYSRERYSISEELPVAVASNEDID